MRSLLLFVLVLSMSFAAFTITAMDVIVNVNEDGSADITENIYLLITTDYHISVYTNGLTQNDLASWNSLTGLSDIRYHVDNRDLDVQDVVVRPQPVSRCNPLADLCHGELKISYHVDAYRNKEGEAVNATGLFLADGYKPRTTRYTLNTQALAFEQSELGDVILSENQRLTFIMPGRVTLIEVSPLPEEVEAADLRGTKELSWENTVLAHFKITFESEESLDTEVLEFFMETRNAMTGLVSGPEGPAVIVLAVIIVGGYLHLQTKVKKVAKK
ncbi:hypothetical protein JW721_05085 [Candidatus Micrarchaeota archaeon]|nr:hypothetical protein [Candidatus Micrarchaeota archaeon]